MTSNNAITQATMLKRTHEIQCGKCAMSDYAENIGVWNDDGTLQELGLCGECEDEEEELDVEKLEFEGNTYLKDDDENVYNYDLTEVEKIGVWDEQNKRIVFDDDKRTTEEKEEEFCWEIDCDVCGELQGKDDCPFETGYADDEYICDECFMCCEECSGSKNPVFGARARATGWVCECEDVDDEHNRCIDCDDHLPRTKKTFWGCEECGLNTCEECCENDDGYVMCAGCVRKQKEVCMCVRDCACV